MRTVLLSRRAFVAASAGLVLADRLRPPVLARQAATAAAAGDVLVEAEFAADELPGGEVEAFFYQVTLPPGETLSHPIGPYCGCGGEQLVPGAGLELVQAGSYAVRLDAPFRVLRAGGAEEGIAAGTGAVLGPGDAARFPDYAATGEIRADGAEPVVVVGLAIVSAAETGTPVAEVPVAVRGEALASMTPMTWSGLAESGPVVVRVRRLELPAGGEIGPYAPDGVEAILVEAGDLDVSTVRPGETAPASPPFSYAEGKAVPFLLLAEGNTRLLANPGDEPATLLVLSVSPGAAGAATPSA